MPPDLTNALIGTRVALGDGVGCAAEVAAELLSESSNPLGTHLLLGWVPEGQLKFDPASFGSVRTVMGGYGVRRAIDQGTIKYVAVRMGAVPALLQGPLRCDSLLASVAVGKGGGHVFTTESAWQRSIVDSGALILGIERTGVPVLDAGPPLPMDQVHIIDTYDKPPAVVRWGEPTEVDRTIADYVTALIPEGARIQYAPGPLGTAVVEAIRSPVQIETGMITDAVMDLDCRGLMLGTAVAPYVGGSEALYDWIEGRGTVDRIENTHNPARLAESPPFISINTALEIDFDGQINVEKVGGSNVAGIGGHPDYAFAAARSIHGLSIVAVPTHRGGHCTLVEKLSTSASTPSHDVDVIATEYGIAELRGKDRAERRAEISRLWRM